MQSPVGMYFWWEKQPISRHLYWWNFRYLLAKDLSEMSLWQKGIDILKHFPKRKCLDSLKGLIFIWYSNQSLSRYWYQWKEQFIFSPIYQRFEWNESLTKGYWYSQTSPWKGVSWFLKRIDFYFIFQTAHFRILILMKETVYTFVYCQRLEWNESLTKG